MTDSFDEPWRPSREDLAAAEGTTVPDVIDADLQVLFCGINPGLYSGAVGHHFARPGNRFWKVLHGAGFTDRLCSPFEDAALVSVGVGVTNLVERATAGAAELSAAELRRGAHELEVKVRRWRPRAVAVLGMQAYRSAFARPRAGLGRQPEAVGDAVTWLLPNPSGAQARYRMDDLVAAFRSLREAT